MIKWKSRDDIDETISALVDPQKLFRIYGYSLFVGNAFYADDFKPSTTWADTIIFSSFGEQIFEFLLTQGLNYPKEVVAFIFFKLFYHNDLFIDHERVDETSVFLLLQEMHSSGLVRWPYVYGNFLYHKFNNLGLEKADFLNAEGVDLLLKDTPQGIFQVGTLLSGPLGFTISKESRSLFPILSINLWHCPDPGCRHPHEVDLKQHKSELSLAEITIMRTIADSFGPPSRWRWPLIKIGEKQLSSVSFRDLSSLLSDCILGEDRKSLALRAMRSQHFKVLSDAIKGAKGLEGEPSEILNSLSQEELHQLVLLLPDRTIISLIDELVSSKTIKIPPSELRCPRTYPYPTRYVSSELSSLGLRCIEDPPVIKLSSLICTTYEKLKMSDDLGWRVRGYSGNTLHHSVLDFIRAQGPVSAVRDLVLPAKSVFTEIANDLCFTIFKNEEEIQTCNRLLWKCGFNLARYEEDCKIFRERIAQFRECVLQMSQQPDEAEQAKIRSIGVNLFVSVEEFLENMLCYNAWLLSSDHFSGTGFSYTKAHALLTVPRVLGDEIESGTQLLRWNKDGYNTLGVLLGYLHAFRAWLKGRPATDKTLYLRRLEEYPHYASYPFLIFPFKHTELWCDVPSTVMTQYSDTFDKICVQLAQSNVASVRNAIDHKRDEELFPTADTMLACASRLLEALDIADSTRLVPKLYWGQKTESDASGNACVTLADYKNSSISLWKPSPIILEIARELEVPHLVAPFDLLNIPNSMLAFFISPQTSYRDYWENYPRKGSVVQDAVADEDCTV